MPEKTKIHAICGVVVMIGNVNTNVKDVLRLGVQDQLEEQARRIDLSHLVD
jgi:hypothetical protein